MDFVILHARKTPSNSSLILPIQNTARSINSSEISYCVRCSYGDPGPDFLILSIPFHPFHDPIDSTTARKQNSKRASLFQDSLIRWSIKQVLAYFHSERYLLGNPMIALHRPRFFFLRILLWAPCLLFCHIFVPGAPTASAAWAQK